MKHGDQSLARLAAGFGVELPEDGVRRLEMFETLLLERAVPLGMVAMSDAGRIRLRHVGDSLRAVAALRPPDRLAYDVGSGAGLPGIVVAISRPDLAVSLVEPRRTRVAFLELAVEALGLENVSVVEARIEDLTESADVCFARAFAPQAAAWRAVRRLLRQGGRLVYFAGAAEGVERAAGQAPGSSTERGAAAAGTAPVAAPGAIETGFEDVAAPSSVEVLPPVVLESGGPLIIMTR
ncbi:MAG: 16S rRNA (guanine(527)-N(7))-methyltransferase RsmG [Actinomycetota bacterium]